MADGDEVAGQVRDAGGVQAERAHVGGGARGGGGLVVVVFGGRGGFGAGVVVGGGGIGGHRGVKRRLYKVAELRMQVLMYKRSRNDCDGV